MTIGGISAHIEWDFALMRRRGTECGQGWFRPPSRSADREHPGGCSGTCGRPDQDHSAALISVGSTVTQRRAERGVGTSRLGPASLRGSRSCSRGRPDIAAAPQPISHNRERLSVKGQGDRRQTRSCPAWQADPPSTWTSFTRNGSRTAWAEGTITDLEARCSPSTFRKTSMPSPGSPRPVPEDEVCADHCVTVRCLR